MNEQDKDSARDAIRDHIDDSIRASIRMKMRGRKLRGDPHMGGGPQGAFHGVIVGAFICLIGVLILLDHLGYISVDHLWRFWPMILILAGVTHLTQTGKRALGAGLVVVGVLFQLDSLSIIRFHWVDLWPLAIIAAGLAMIWGSLEARRVRESVSGDTKNTTNIAAIFGGIERRITAHDFRGGTISAVFGGAELDFRDADMEGDETVLEVNAVFGGAEIRVPENWRVEVRAHTLFGGYSDSTRGSAPGDPNATKRKTLILTGTTLFGGVEIKN
jgi:predicted membrane protein